MRVLLFAALLGVAACGSEPDDTDVVEAPTFTQVRDEVLVMSCGLSTCHDPTTAEAGLILDASVTPDDLVDVESLNAPGEILVVAGDPDASYLVKKIEGASDIVDDPMPPPFGGLPQEQIDLIRDWIAADAAND